MTEDLTTVIGNYEYPSYIGLESSSPYLYMICDRIAHTASVISILNELGYEEFANELKPDLKYWVSELVIKLATQKYVNGLATELSYTTERLWSRRFSEEELRAYLHKLVSFGLAAKEGRATREEAKDILLDFIYMFGVDLSRAQCVRKILDEADPQLVLQTLLVGLIISAEGLGNGPYSDQDGCTR